jgi:uncharacterized membrane protein
VLVAILIFGIALRLFRLNQQSLWLDEIGEGSVASTPFPHFFSEVRYGAGAAPLDYLGVKLTLSLFGHGTTATRLWALLCGILVIFLTYKVGTEFFKNAAVGLIAALMVSVSAFLIFYSQEARFYSLAALLGLLNLWAFNRGFERDRRIDWLLFGLVVALGLYGHYFLAALVATEGVFLVAYWLWAAARARWSQTTLRRGAGQVGRFLVASIAGIVVFVPWLLFAAGGTLNWGWPPPPPLDLARLHQIAVVLLALAPLNSVPSWNLAAWARTDVVLALALLGLVVALVRGRIQVLLLAITPPLMVVLAWRADQAAHYFWSERQVIAALPMLYLLAASGAAFLGAALWRIPGRLGRERTLKLEQNHARLIAGLLIVVLAALWVAFNAGPIRRVYAGTWNGKEDWRGAASFISSQACPDSRFYSFLDGHSSYGFAWYAPSLTPRSDSIFRAAGTGDLLEAVRSVRFGPHDWIVVTIGSAVQDEGGTTANGALEVGGWTYRDFKGLRVYDRPPTCGH